MSTIDELDRASLMVAESDRQLADRWIYCDLVHADELSSVFAGTTLEDRWHEAVPFIARVIEVIEWTYSPFVSVAGLIVGS